MLMEPKIYKSLDDITNDDSRYDLNKVIFFTATDNGELIIPDVGLFDIYFRYVQPYVSEVAVTPTQAQFYRCRPHLLSLDIYGTPHLAWLILKLNDKECPSKFFLKKSVRLVIPERLIEVYDTIATKSSGRLTKNHNKYLSLVGGDTGGS